MPDPTLEAAPSTRDEEIELRRLWYALRRNLWVVLATTCVMIAAAALLALVQQPAYQSRATILLAEERPGIDLLRGMVPAGLGVMAGLPSGAGNIQTDIAVLRSRQVAEGVVDSLGLRVALLERGMPRSEVLRVLEAGAGAEKGSFRLQRGNDGAYTLHLEEGDRPPALPDRVEIGQPFRLYDITLALGPALQAHPPARIRFEIRPYRTAVEEVQDRLRVERLGSGVQIVEVTYRDPDPVLAAAVPNVVSQSFLHYKNSISRAETHSTIEFLQQQAAAYEAELRNAEARVQGFREQAQLIEPSVQATEQVRRLAEVQAEREGLHAERESLGRLLTRIEARAGARDAHEATRAVGSSPYRELAAFPTFIANGAVQDILQSLLQLENQRANLLVQRTAQSIDVRGIDSRISELELQLYQLARNYVSGTDSRILSLDALLARASGQMGEIPARQIEFHRLAREQKLLEEVYTLIQTKLKEAQIESASEPANVRLVDSALVPEKPVSPRPLLYLALATVFGLMMGVSGAFVREYFDTRVRTREDVAAMVGLPLLGMIPRVGAAPTANGNGRKKGVPRLGRRATLHPHPRLVTREDPGSPAAEAFRALRTNLLVAAAERATQILVVTSAVAEDGKSTAAANLAITLAQQGTRTLLVDADLRRGTVHDLFGLARAPGLSELVGGEAALEEAIRQVPAGHSGATLDVLPSGMTPEAPAEMLGSEAMRGLLARLRAEYAAIILDAPPLNPVTDSALLALVADGVLLVARAGATDRGALQEAADQVRRLGVPTRGVVLNDVEQLPSPYYEPQRKSG